MVVCEPGTYRLQTGQGPLDVDPDCGSSHCELLKQTTLAMLEVVRSRAPSNWLSCFRTPFCFRRGLLSIKRSLVCTASVQNAQEVSLQHGAARV